jgi:hypothetical protein
MENKSNLVPETATGDTMLAAIPREDDRRLKSGGKLTAPIAGRESNLTRLPPEYERRFESTEELRAFLDEKEMLRRLPISRRTLFTWVESGKLPCVKIRRRKLFHWQSCVDALLRMQRGGDQ